MTRSNLKAPAHTDIQPFDLVPLADFAKKVKRSYNSLRNWTIKGCKPEGWCTGDPLVTLRTCKLGGARHTSEEWYRQFVEELNP